MSLAKTFAPFLSDNEAELDALFSRWQGTHPDARSFDLMRGLVMLSDQLDRAHRKLDAIVLALEALDVDGGGGEDLSAIRRDLEALVPLLSIPRDPAPAVAPPAPPAPPEAPARPTRKRGQVTT